MIRPLSYFFALLAVLFLQGCGDDAVDEAGLLKSAPVTVLQLEEQEFSRETRLTGSVTLYREEDVGFEVSGRLLAVLDTGREVIGPAFNELGIMVRPGEIIATIEDTRYRLRAEAVAARLDAARSALESAQADLTLADQTLQRQNRIFSQGAGSQQAVDAAQSTYDRAVAQISRSEAVVQEITEELERAQEDRSDTNLYAPFSGRITRIHVSQGAVIDAGRPVVTLSLLDPIQVQVAVSADEERRIQTGDRAVIYPKDPLNPDGEPTPVNTIVFEKDAVADPSTRTFRIKLIARNARRRIEQIRPETKGLPVVSDFLPVVREFQGEEGDLFVSTESIYEEDGKTFVFRLPGVSFNPDAKRSAVGKHIPEKVLVTLGENYNTVIKWNFISLNDSADLREGDFLVLGPKAEHLDGLAIGRPQWLLRPGDLIPVRFFVNSTPPGFYVPVNAITLIDNRHVVFVVEDDFARLKNVTVGETYQETRRIEGDGIEAGTSVIVGGTHYVSDGQPVNIVGREALAQ